MVLLVSGSAFLLFGCAEQLPEDDRDPEKLITMRIDSIRLINSENGKLSYVFTAPLMEYYGLAAEPYREFSKGVDVVTYDSIGGIASTLVADYAIFFEKRKLWEAKGNVVAVKRGEATLETQQLFWNQQTHKVYSNVDSRITQGQDVIVGEGFESDETFDDFVFRQPRGKVLVDVEPTDSASTPAPSTPPVIQSGTPATGAQPAAAPASAKPTATDKPSATGTPPAVAPSAAPPAEKPTLDGPRRAPSRNRKK